MTPPLPIKRMKRLLETPRRVVRRDLRWNFTPKAEARDAVIWSEAERVAQRWLNGDSDSADDPEHPNPDRCHGCEMSEYEVVYKFFKKEKKSVDFFVKHGIYPSKDTLYLCEDCGHRVRFNPRLKPLPGWSCKKVNEWVKVPKKKERKLKRCRTHQNHINLRSGAFMGKSTLPTWKVLMMALLFCQRDNRHCRSQSNLGVSLGVSSKYRRLFQEATVDWIDSQEPIGGQYRGGAPIIVELDESLFISTKHVKGSKRSIESCWVFGGIERYSKKSFLFPLSKVHKSKTGAKKWCRALLRDSDTLIPLIQRFVKPGSLIITDGWTAYLSLCDYGYLHHRVIHQREWVSAGRPWIHTQTIERLWGDLKDVCLRRGQRKAYLKEILGRYVFLCTIPERKAVHELLSVLAKKHKHPLVSFD